MTPQHHIIKETSETLSRLLQDEFKRNGYKRVHIVEQAPQSFRVEAVAGGRDVAALAELAIRVGARFAAIRDESLYNDLKSALSGSNVQPAAGARETTPHTLGPEVLMTSICSKPARK